MTTEAIGVEGLTVVGQRRGQAAALGQQLAAPTITNVVAADQIGRFQTRISGTPSSVSQVLRSFRIRERPRFGLIRGTEPRLNSVMINGERIPSAEAEVREVQLDLIPSGHGGSGGGHKGVDARHGRRCDRRVRQHRDAGRPGRSASRCHPGFGIQLPGIRADGGSEASSSDSASPRIGSA